MRDWRILLLQYLLQQNRSVTGEDKTAAGVNECKQYCGMPLLTDLTVMMRIDPLVLVRRTKGVCHGGVRTGNVIRVSRRASESVQELVVVCQFSLSGRCSVLNWVEEKELRGLASDDRLFARIAEPGWILMVFKNSFKCRMGDVDGSHIQFNPKLWNLRPVVKDTGEAMRVPAWAEAYAHVKENQGAWLAGFRPLPSQCPKYPPIRRMLLGLTSPVVASCIRAARDVEKRMQKWSEGMEPRFISWNVAAMHIFDFCYPDAWNRKKIKPPRSRKPDVSSDVWSKVYTRADDLSRLKWPGEMKVVLLEVPKKLGGGTDITIDELAPHGDESVEFLVNNELFYHAGDLTVPARPDSVMDISQGPSGLGPRPYTNDDAQMDQDDDPMEGKKDKSSGLDLGALERDLLEYQFSEDDDDGDVDGHLLLMTPSYFMSPTREAPASLSPVDPIGLAVEYRSRDTQKLLHESPRRKESTRQ